MDDNIKHGQQSFLHIARKAELVQANDRDVVAIWPDMLVNGASPGMVVWRNEDKSFAAYKTDPYYEMQYGERGLLWARMSGDEMVGGLRWVPYITDSYDTDTYFIRPLREVFSPSINYDATSNTLTMWFWTNVKADYNGYDYHEEFIYPVEVNQGGLVDSDWHLQTYCKRVLCYTTGFFAHLYAEHGFMDGFQVRQSDYSPDLEDSRWDLVPVFRCPKIINWQENPGSEGGVVVDGATSDNAILAKITGSPSNGEYPVDFYANGKNEDSTDSGTIEVLNLCLSEELPTGTWLVVDNVGVKMTGGTTPSP